MTKKAAAPKTAPAKAEGLRLRARLRSPYHGSSPLAVPFRPAVIAVHFRITGFFSPPPGP